MYFDISLGSASVNLLRRSCRKRVRSETLATSRPRAAMVACDMEILYTEGQVLSFLTHYTIVLV